MMTRLVIEALQPTEGCKQWVVYRNLGPALDNGDDGDGGGIFTENGIFGGSATTLGSYNEVRALGQGGHMDGPDADDAEAHYSDAGKKGYYSIGTARLGALHDMIRMTAIAAIELDGDKFVVSDAALRTKKGRPIELLDGKYDLDDEDDADERIDLIVQIAKRAWPDARVEWVATQDEGGLAGVIDTFAKQRSLRIDKIESPDAARLFERTQRAWEEIEEAEERAAEERAVVKRTRRRGDDD